MKTQGISLPKHVVALNMGGSVLLGIGLAQKFGHVDLIPAALHFNGDALSFIVVGALFMATASVYVIKGTFNQAQNSNTPKR